LSAVTFFFYFGSLEAIITVQRVTPVTYNPVDIHSNATHCAKQVASPASCLQCHKGYGKTPTYENLEKVSCLDSKFVLAT